MAQGYRAVRAVQQDAPSLEDALIRPDLIEATATARLVEAQAVIQRLLRDEGDGGDRVTKPTSALARYAEKQFAAVAAELEGRRAEDRVAALLAGETIIVQDDNPEVPKDYVDDEPEKRQEKSHDARLRAIFSAKSSGVPLPSELVAKALADEDEASVASSRALGGSTRGGDDEADDGTTGGGATRPQRRRPSKLRAAQSENKSWGSTVCVGGGNGGLFRRASKRKKPVQETHDQTLERQREERRSAALKRLQSRRTQRIERKRQDRRRKQEQEQEPHAKKGDLSSDSESVSGGDSSDDDADDDAVVETAAVEAASSTSSSSSSAPTIDPPRPPQGQVGEPAAVPREEAAAVKPSKKPGAALQEDGGSAGDDGVPVVVAAAASSSSSEPAAVTEKNSIPAAEDNGLPPSEDKKPPVEPEAAPMSSPRPDDGGQEEARRHSTDAVTGDSAGECALPPPPESPTGRANLFDDDEDLAGAVGRAAPTPTPTPTPQRPSQDEAARSDDNDDDEPDDAPEDAPDDTPDDAPDDESAEKEGRIDAVAALVVQGGTKEVDEDERAAPHDDDDDVAAEDAAWDFSGRDDEPSVGEAPEADNTTAAHAVAPAVEPAAPSPRAAASRREEDDFDVDDDEQACSRVDAHDEGDALFFSGKGGPLYSFRALVAPDPSTVEPREASLTVVRRPVEAVVRDFSAHHADWDSIFSRWASSRFRRKRANPAEVRAAMSRQWRLYTVFSAVMGDYAAVFSSGMARLESSSTRSNEAVYEGTASSLHFRVNSSRPDVFDIVTSVLSRDSKWVELPAGLGLKTTWNLLWTWSKPRVNYDHLLAWQRVNHYPMAKHLTRKDMLARNVMKMSRMLRGSRFEGDFDICPLTFLLPQDYPAMVQAFRAAQRDHDDATDAAAAAAAAAATTTTTTTPQPLWIMKPVALSRGRGITVVQHLDDVTYADQVVVQRYVPYPLLLSGHKFDLRLYVLVTSFAPLEAFIYKRGFARVATKPFSAKPSEVDDKLVHLTNASIQKRGAYDAKTGPFKTATAEDAAGTKCTLEFLWRRLKLDAPALDTEAIWASIKCLILKSLVCVEDQIPHQPNSFEVFGYDVLIDADLRPWLIEVNTSPSMDRSTALDAEIKEAMIRDTIRLVDPVPYDRSALVEVLDRRLRAMELGERSAMAQHPQRRRGKAAQVQADDTVLNADLSAVLHGARRRPRNYGEAPDHPGDYEPLAPSPLHDRIRKMKRSVCKGTDPNQ